jgi:hypothetical protein
MNKLKLILTMALTFVVLFAQVGNVAAAPLAATNITGTVTGIALDTDANNVTTVLVTLNETQTVRISVDTANGLGLLDSMTGDPVPVNGQIVTITADTIIPDTTPVEEPVINPISDLLAGFFHVDASVIEGYHTDDGFGFGVIAQALWMSRNLTGKDGQVGDASLAKEILSVKRGDETYEKFFEEHPGLLAEGATTPTNWGQFRKAFSNKKNNLGVVVSGQSDESNTTTQSEHGNGNDNGHGNGNNGNNGHNGNGHGKGNGKNP